MQWVRATQEAVTEILHHLFLWFSFSLENILPEPAWTGQITTSRPPNSDWNYLIGMKSNFYHRTAYDTFKKELYELNSGKKKIDLMEFILFFHNLQTLGMHWKMFCHFTTFFVKWLTTLWITFLLHCLCFLKNIYFTKMNF